VGRPSGAAPAQIHVWWNIIQTSVEARLGSKVSASLEPADAGQCTYGVSPIGRLLVGLLVVVLAIPFALFTYFGYPVMTSQGKGAPLVYGFAILSVLMVVLGTLIIAMGHRVRVVLTDTRVVVRSLLTSQEILLADVRRIYRGIDAIVLEGDGRKVELDDWYFNGSEDIRSFASTLRQRVGMDCEFTLDPDSPRWSQ